MASRSQRLNAVVIKGSRLFDRTWWMLGIGVMACAALGAWMWPEGATGATSEVSDLTPGLRAVGFAGLGLATATFALGICSDLHRGEARFASCIKARRDSDPLLFHMAVGIEAALALLLAGFAMALLVV